ncbi:MAG TPA: hypothetical protein VIF09_04335 [Polyangiaceae bacterium]|jgi:hypothetical protein
MIPLTAFTPTGAYLGTDRVERALTNEESKRLGKMLRERGFLAASVTALAYAQRLTRNADRAQDLVGRMHVRLVCQGWDPAFVSLKKALLRFVWSEHTNEKSETDKARRAADRFLGEQEATGAVRPAAPARGDPLLVKKEPFVPSVEAQLLTLGLERRDAAKAARQTALHTALLAELRKRLEAKKDTVGLAYLDEKEKGNDDLDLMVARTGHPVEEFYAAQKRRKRLVKALLAEAAGEPAPVDDDD